MDAMPSYSKSPSIASSAEQILFELQVEQHHHDELYHREIARLSLHGRLNHMALHFCKYTGKIGSNSDSAKLLAVCVDVLIIALSTANILNVKLWDIMENRGTRIFPGLLAYGRSLAAETDEDIASHSVLLRKTAIASGCIASACEKIDHLEPISYRAEIQQGISELARIALSFISLSGVEPSQAVRDRLSSVKERLVLHNRI